MNSMAETLYNVEEVLDLLDHEPDDDDQELGDFFFPGSDDELGSVEEEVGREDSGSDDGAGSEGEGSGSEDEGAGSEDVGAGRGAGSDGSENGAER